MTKQEALTKHRTMWNLIADMIEAGEIYDNVMKYKIEAWKKMKEGYSPIWLCYCCDYAKDCSECPVIWGSSKEKLCGNAEYRLFEVSLIRGNYIKAASIAREIANLPEREE